MAEYNLICSRVNYLFVSNRLLLEWFGAKGHLLLVPQAIDLSFTRGLTCLELTLILKLAPILYKWLLPKTHKKG